MDGMDLARYQRELFDLEGPVVVDPPRPPSKAEQARYMADLRYFIATGRCALDRQPELRTYLRGES